MSKKAKIFVQTFLPLECDDGGVKKFLESFSPRTSLRKDCVYEIYCRVVENPVSEFDFWRIANNSVAMRFYLIGNTNYMQVLSGERK